MSGKRLKSLGELRCNGPVSVPSLLSTEGNQQEVVLPFSVQCVLLLAGTKGQLSRTCGHIIVRTTLRLALQWLLWSRGTMEMCRTDKSRKCI